MEIINKEPSCENYIRLTFPTPCGRSKVSCVIYLKSVAEYTFILFYPAMTIFDPLATAMASNGAVKTLLLVISSFISFACVDTVQ